jgi:MFS family permease
MTANTATSSPPSTAPAARRAVAAAGIGWGLDGLTWTMYSFALTIVLPVLGISTGEAGWITALSIAASAVGGVLCGLLADRLGRVRVLTWVIIGYSLFTALTATAQDFTQFLTWRVLEGLAFGGEWAVGAALVAEYANPARRGRVLAFVQSCYALGWAVSTATYVVVFSLAPPETAWRYLFVIGVLPALAAFAIRRTTQDRVDVAVVGRREKSQFATLFTGPQARITVLATLLGIGIQAIYYSVFVFLPLFLKTERGLSVVGTAAYTWVVIVGSFAGYVASGFVHDALGRRPTFAMFFAGSVASIALFVLTPIARPEIGYVISLALGFFASGQAGGMGAYLAELFPTAIRASGQGFAYNVGRGLAGFGPLVVGSLAGTIGLGQAVLWVGAAGAVAGLVALVWLPETRHRNILADVEPPAATALDAR